MPPLRALLLVGPWALAALLVSAKTGGRGSFLGVAKRRSITSPRRSSRLVGWWMRESRGEGAGWRLDSLGLTSRAQTHLMGVERVRWCLESAGALLRPRLGVEGRYGSAGGA